MQAPRKAWRKIGHHFLHVKIVLLSLAADSVSSGNLSVFDVIGIKTREIVGHATSEAVDIVANGNEVSCPWQHRNFKAKLRLQTSVMPYSSDIHTMLVGKMRRMKEC